MTESPSSPAFQPPIVVRQLLEPQENTIIALHGRGWTASRFSQFLLDIQIKEGKTLRDFLPHSKFVFPQAQRSRASKYKRSAIHQWYDGSGDWEPEALGGMRAGVEYILDLLTEEAKHWGSDASRVVLMGHSQGCAVAMVSLLLRGSSEIGAVVGTCGFIPLNALMQDILNEDADVANSDVVFGLSDHEAPELDPVQKALNALGEEVEVKPTDGIACQRSTHTPICLLHGAEDDEVVITHGRLASTLLQKFGFTNVHFHEFEMVGHTITPGMLAKTVEFLYQTAHFHSL